MWHRRSYALFLVMSLLANALCLPPKTRLRKRRDLSDNQIHTITSAESSKANVALNKDRAEVDDVKSVALAADDDFDDDFDEEFEKQPASSNGGGSNIISLLNVATALFPTLSANNNIKKNNDFVKKLIRDAIVKYQQTRAAQKRKDLADNVIEIDYATDLKPPVFERQESEENDDSDSASNGESDEDDGAEESVEDASVENGNGNGNQDAASDASNGNGSDDNDSDYDEPEGDGQGGILGLLAGLSGDGESDLGSLLATIGGIVANLSGDGIDLNAIIATGIGLFVGLLSDEGTNPGEIIGSYLLTSLDTITGGGAQNNGAFFGKFLSTLVKGTSAAENADDSGSDENGGGTKMADSAGFFFSLIMGLLGEMSKQSSNSGWR